MIDLTVVTNNIINNVNKYEITNENCHSDHVCIKITLNEIGCENSEIIKHKINIEKYKEEIKELNTTEFEDLNQFELKHKQIIENNTEIKKMNLDEKHYPKNFWSKYIKTLYTEKRKDLKNYNKNRNMTNYLKLKKSEAIVHKEIRRNKRKNFQKFVEGLNPTNSLKTIYNNYNKLKNKDKFVHNNYIENSKNNAATFLNNKFEHIKFNITFEFNEMKNDYYNSDFKRKEVYDMIKTKSKKITASGKDKTTFKMINLWSEEVKDFFMEEINKIWNGENLPDEYREVLVKTILKPGKDKEDIDSYL